MIIDGKTKTCGLMGNPVEHTLSPIIHNTLAERMEQNLVYVPFHVENKDVEQAVKGAFALSILGMNVTVPHKSAVIPFLAEIDPLARSIGAVNTLVRTEAGYKGYNTDMTGLLRAMQSEHISVKDKKVILLGAGGAARAVAFLLASEGAKKVYLLNRSVSKGQLVVDEVNQALGTDILSAHELDYYRKLPQEKYLVIQGTSVGLYPNADQAVIEEPDFYKLVETGVDLIYKPAKTKFMKLCEEAGANTMNGLKMLLYQGIIAYELWNQVHVDRETELEIYQKMKDATKIDE